MDTVILIFLSLVVILMISVGGVSFFIRCQEKGVAVLFGIVGLITFLNSDPEDNFIAYILWFLTCLLLYNIHKNNKDSDSNEKRRQRAANRGEIIYTDKEGETRLTETGAKAWITNGSVYTKPFMLDPVLVCNLKLEYQKKYKELCLEKCRQYKVKGYIPWENRHDVITTNYRYPRDFSRIKEYTYVNPDSINQKYKVRLEKWSNDYNEEFSIVFDYTTGSTKNIKDELVQRVLDRFDGKQIDSQIKSWQQELPKPVSFEGKCTEEYTEYYLLPNSDHYYQKYIREEMYPNRDLNTDTYEERFDYDKNTGTYVCEYVHFINGFNDYEYVRVIKYRDNKVSVSRQRILIFQDQDLAEIIKYYHGLKMFLGDRDFAEKVQRMERTYHFTSY